MTLTPHNMLKHRARIAADLCSRMWREMSHELRFVVVALVQVMRSVDLIHTARAGTTT
jgi:hypothetical protein